MYREIDGHFATSSAWVEFMTQGSLLGPLFFFNIICINDFSAGTFSLRLYADDTTQYAAHESPDVIESTLNRDVIKLTQWISRTIYKAIKTQAMTLGKFQFRPLTSSLLLKF